jgi:antitoxin PrlF
MSTSIKAKQATIPATNFAEAAPVEYFGKRTKTGNSTGFRFEGALFKSHPEFSGNVRAQVIAPGRLLVVAEPTEEPAHDPVVASFLAFLQADMVQHPDQIRPVKNIVADEMSTLVGGLAVDPNEDLGDEDLLAWS